MFIEDQKVNKEVPAIFQKLNEFDSKDGRFIQVKIWLMHTGENLNGSYFSKESVIDAIPTLKNNPILAYIEDNSLGEKDFSDHRMELQKEDGKYKIKYLCNAIGVIPETNNAKFEFRLCDDGVEREFLTVEGLIWQKWDDPINIFNRDIIKSQSMELHDDYEGYFGEDNLFHFTKFKFFGACALGKDVQPAMHNANIEINFNKEGAFSHIKEKLEEFKQLLNQSPIREDEKQSLQGGNNVDEILKMLESYSLKLEDLQAKKIDYEKLSIEELEEKIKKEFSLTASQLEFEARRVLEGFGQLTYKDDWLDEEYSYPKYGLVDIDMENRYVVATDREGWHLVGFSYSLEGDKLNIDKESVRRFKVVYSPMELGEEVSDVFNLLKDHMTEKDEKAKNVFAKLKKELSDKEKQIEDKNQEYANLQEKYVKVESELNETLKKYSEKIKQERLEQEEGLFSTFAKELSEEEMKEVKENKDSMSIEEIEDKLFALVGKKKAKFNLIEQKSKNEKQVIDLDMNNKPKNKFGKSYEDLFSKYGFGN